MWAKAGLVWRDFESGSCVSSTRAVALSKEGVRCPQPHDVEGSQNGKQAQQQQRKTPLELQLIPVLVQSGQTANTQLAQLHARYTGMLHPFPFHASRKLTQCSHRNRTRRHDQVVRLRPSTAETQLTPPSSQRMVHPPAPRHLLLHPRAPHATELHLDLGWGGDGADEV